jgi:hypothetical protein
MPLMPINAGEYARASVCRFGSAPSLGEEIRTAKEVASRSPALSRFQTYRVLMLFGQSTRNRPNLSRLQAWRPRYSGWVT